MIARVQQTVDACLASDIILMTRPISLFSKCGTDVTLETTVCYSAPAFATAFIGSYLRQLSSATDSPICAAKDSDKGQAADTALCDGSLHMDHNVPQRLIASHFGPLLICLCYRLPTQIACQRRCCCLDIVPVASIVRASAATCCEASVRHVDGR